MYSCNPQHFWSIQWKENNVWQDPGYGNNMAFQLPITENDKEICHIAFYERMEPCSMDIESSLSAEWNQKICPFSKGLDPFDPVFIDKGHYRFVFRYGLRVSEIDPYKIENPITIYSNEFTIR